jgi:predicted transposase/invertase (TIGR01784 family)
LSFPIILFFYNPYLALNLELPERRMWEVAKGLDTIEDQRVKANLMAATAVFAGLVMEPEMIKTILRSDMMKESAFYQEILQEGRLEGRLEGEREGKLKVGQQLLRLGMS